MRLSMNCASRNGALMDHQLSISGGTENTRVALGASYPESGATNQSGVFIGLEVGQADDDGLRCERGR